MVVDLSIVRVPMGAGDLGSLSEVPQHSRLVSRRHVVAGWTTVESGA